MATALSVQAPVTSGIAPLRRSGWLLIVAFLAFVLALGYLIVAGADFDRENAELAKAAGTSINAVPAAEQARLVVRYSTYWIVSTIFLFVPFGVFAAGFHALYAALRTTTDEALSRAAWWLGLGMTVIFYAFGILSLGLLAGPDNLPPVVRNLDAIMIPSTALFSTLGLGAVICAGLAARRARIAPRTGLAAAILSGLFALLGVALFVGSGFTDNLPPFAPFITALILAIGLVRSKGAQESAQHR